MQVINTPISPYVQNAPIAYCEETKESIYIDPGDELDKLIAVQESLDLKPQYIQYFASSDSLHELIVRTYLDINDVVIITPDIL